MVNAIREERVDEVLWDWACNHDDLDIAKVKAELRHLFHEQESEQIRKEMMSGNKEIVDFRGIANDS